MRFACFCFNLSPDDTRVEDTGDQKACYSVSTIFALFSNISPKLDFIPGFYPLDFSQIWSIAFVIDTERQIDLANEK
jgi:hypothetical protein